ncbi:antitoxin [Brucella endophytica]|uniref:Antitoxin n=1 Tax=Brucella endophytica TaxID=1963359 RepID=A0A916SHS9_9HYPH|nr:type II toxin-antitoxin system ParD family antitoxin [Brucella endophytica]GGA96892.1 antitoxin [Brucella endophytica]
MATMNISLPDPMKEWVEAQAETGRYANASDYVRDLIRQDQVRREKIAVMQQAVDAGLASGISNRTVDEIFEAAARRVGISRDS